MMVGYFMGMVGALIWDPVSDRYLILKRSGEKDYARHVWECGTGRVNQGETYTTALKREMKEELGVDIQIDFIIGTTHFFRGEAIPENEMLGIYYCCTVDNPQKIQLSWEHSEYRWVTLDEAVAFLTDQYWLVRLIDRAALIRSMTSDHLLAFNHREGLEF